MSYVQCNGVAPSSESNSTKHAAEPPLMQLGPNLRGFAPLIHVWKRRRINTYIQPQLLSKPYPTYEMELLRQKGKRKKKKKI